MKQEDYNDMMRYPGEVRVNQKPPELPLCPKCQERYLGDGKQLCTECAAEEQP